MDSAWWFDRVFYGLVLFSLLDWFVHVTKTMPTLNRHRKTSFIDWIFAGPHQIKNIRDYKQILIKENSPLTWYYVRQILISISAGYLIAFILVIFIL